MSNPPLYFEDRGSGFPVVFLHAFPLDRQMWESAVEAVINAGFRTITLDFPGFGNSKGRIESIASAAKEVVKTLKVLHLDRFAVCGLSMGGYVGFELINCCGDSIQAAVFCDTTADADSTDKQGQRFAAIEEIRSKGSGNFFDQLAKTLLSRATTEQNPALAKAIRARFDAATDEAIMAAQNAMARRDSTFESLAALDFPVLLIFGTDDPMLSAGERMHQEIPKSSLVAIEDAGHFPNLETPQAFNEALVRFLRRQSFE